MSSYKTSQGGLSPQHGLEYRLKGYFYIQFIGAGEFHIDCLIPCDEVTCVVDTLNPHGVLIHYVSAIRLRETELPIT